ncbi:MAG: MAPEG family protein [Xanthomonadales bacterium]|nr:MAPEG family protein [Xanthomonadales bacterium]
MDYSTIVGVCASLLGLIYLGLSYRVVSIRRLEKIGIGTGGNEPLSLAVRAHANFIEYVPITLILLFLLMRSAGDAMVAAVLMVLLVIARLLHAYGLSGSGGYSVGRFSGTVITWIVLLLTSLLNIYYLVF